MSCTQTLYIIAEGPIGRQYVSEFARDCAEPVAGMVRVATLQLGVTIVDSQAPPATIAILSPQNIVGGISISNQKFISLSPDSTGSEIYVVC